MISYARKSACDSVVLFVVLTVKNWTAPIHQSQIPVRAWVQGVGQGADGNLHAFNHYYDYFAFAPGISDPTVFEVRQIGSISWIYVTIIA